MAACAGSEDKSTKLTFYCRSLAAGLIAALVIFPVEAVCAGGQAPAPLAIEQKGLPAYEWQQTSVGDGAEILTLVQKPDNPSRDHAVPLVSVLRDSVVPGDPATSRIRYVWLLTYTPPTLAQRFLSAIPFFYWAVKPRVDDKSTEPPKPLADVSEPTHRVFKTVGRSILQWTALDPMTTPVRASSRAFRTNGLDHERLHVEEAISYLRRAPVAKDGSALSQTELDDVIARLMLTKNLLGGFVADGRLKGVAAARDAQRSETVGRNWELLRTSAERAGLLFEPLSLTEGAENYGVIWFPLGATFSRPGVSLDTTWKLLHISNPWNDKKLEDWQGYQETRWLSAEGRLLSEPSQDAKEVEVAPLAVYSLTYPKKPLLMIDFRSASKTRRREIAQRASDEIVSGVLGLSHFGNWYYYAGNALYQFVRGRQGAAVNQAARLDAYSEFRVGLSLNTSMDAEFRKELQKRIQAVALNPLDAPAGREIASAHRHFENLQHAARFGERLSVRIDQDRRKELAAFGESEKERLSWSAVHVMTFGLYTRRAPKRESNRELLSRNRTIGTLMDYMKLVANAGRRPEVSFPASDIQDAIRDLSHLTGPGVPKSIHRRAVRLIGEVRDLTEDAGIRSDCVLALASLGTPAVPRGPAPSARPRPEVVSLSNTQTLVETK
jgi:hypothetical protein